MKIKFLWGWNSLNNDNWSNELLYQIIEKNNKKGRDVLVVFPFLPWGLRIVRRLLHDRIFFILLRFILKIMSYRYKIILASYENQDFGPFCYFGELCRTTNYLIISHWPDYFTDNGIQFPYWFNLIDWDGYPSASCSMKMRFGRGISIEELQNPTLPADWEKRADEAVIVASHERFPRQEMLKDLAHRFKIAKFGKIGKTFKTSKLELLQKYKYSIYDENSLGYCYETEKLAEIIAAGCIPISNGLANGSMFENYELSDNDTKYPTFRLSKPVDIKMVEYKIGLYLAC